MSERSFCHKWWYTRSYLVYEPSLVYRYNSTMHVMGYGWWNTTYDSNRTTTAHFVQQLSFYLNLSKLIQKDMFSDTCQKMTNRKSNVMMLDYAHNFKRTSHQVNTNKTNPSIHRQCFCVQKVEIMDACMENQFVTTIPTNPTINRNHNHYYPNTRPSVTTITQTAAVQSSTGTTVAVNHYHVGSCAVLWRLRLNRISITPVMTTNIVRCSMTLIVKMIGNTTLDSVSRRWVRRVRPPPQHERMSHR